MASKDDLTPESFSLFHLVEPKIGEDENGRERESKNFLSAFCRCGSLGDGVKGGEGGPCNQELSPEKGNKS